MRKALTAEEIREQINSRFVTIVRGGKTQILDLEEKNNLLVNYYKKTR